MRAVFAHDVILTRGRDGRYYSDYFKYELWRRYVGVFGALTVCCRTRSGEDEERLGADRRSCGEGVSVVSLPDLSSPAGMLFRRKMAAAALKEALTGADLLIARLPSEIGLLAVRIARTLGIPYVTEVVGHAWDAYYHYGSLTGKLYAPAATLRMRRAVRTAPYALYVTERFLQGHYPCTGHTIGCSDVELAWPLADHTSVDWKKGPERGLTVGMIAFLSVGYKGVDTALLAVRLLAERGIPIRLRILGGGDAGSWKRLAIDWGVADRVDWCGTLPAGPRIAEWLDGLDLYIQPSRQEGLPRALVEAMSRGLPAFGSKAGGIPELLPPECLIRPGQAGELAELIGRAALDAEWRRELAHRSLETAARYARERLQGERQAFYRDIRNRLKESDGR